MTGPVGETPVSQDIPEEEKESLETVSKETVTLLVHREQDVHYEQDQPQGKSPSISPPVEPIVIKKTQEPLTPVVLKTPHQNPEPVQKPENIQRRNVPRFVSH